MKMRNLKFTANEVLDSLNREFNLEERFEIYKALIACALDINEITDEIDSKLNEVIDFYMDNDYISSIVNEDVLDFAREQLEM